MGKLSTKELSAKEQAIFNRVTVKKLREGFGHDKMGYDCDVYLDNKKVGTVSDDGWGGEVTVDHDNPKQKETYEKFINDNKICKIMFAKLGWQFLDSAEKIGVYSAGLSLVEFAINKKNVDKHTKKINKACLSNIVYGTDYSYNSTGWKKIDLATVVKHPRIGVKGLQDLYDEVKAKLTKGQTIFNTNLEELGIKL